MSWEEMYVYIAQEENNVYICIDPQNRKQHSATGKYMLEEHVDYS
jgi:hypothetical protein